MTRVIWKFIKDKVLNELDLLYLFSSFLPISKSISDYWQEWLRYDFLCWLQLIFPFLELDIKYYDLGLTHRDATDDKVTVESAEATLKYVIYVIFLFD